MTSELAHPRWAEMWNRGLSVGDAFDKGCPSPLLVKYIDEGRIPTGKALVPGCGRGYDVFALASKERYAIGLELSEVAAESALKYHQELALPSDKMENAEIQTQNFFDVPSSYFQDFDFVYDYTFLCALDPSIRTEWAQQMHKVLKPGGILLTLIFHINPERPITQGPPFRVSLEVVEELLVKDDRFEKIELGYLPSDLCHPGRDGTSGEGIRIEARSGVGMWRKK